MLVRRVVLMAAVVAAATILDSTAPSGRLVAQQARPGGDVVPRDLRPEDLFQGRPWTGAQGVTETVAQIMERQRQTPPQPRRLREEFEYHPDKQPNPESLEVSR